jgi:hypothetical protein
MATKSIHEDEQEEGLSVIVTVVMVSIARRSKGGIRNRRYIWVL